MQHSSLHNQQIESKKYFVVNTFQSRLVNGFLHQKWEIHILRVGATETNEIRKFTRDTIDTTVSYTRYYKHLYSLKYQFIRKKLLKKK